MIDNELNGKWWNCFKYNRQFERSPDAFVGTQSRTPCQGEEHFDFTPSAFASCVALNATGEGCFIKHPQYVSSSAVPTSFPSGRSRELHAMAKINS